MALYKLERNEWDVDQITAFVIRAESEAAARAVAVAICGDEGPHWWTDPKCSTCELLEPDGPEGLILIDFAAGWTNELCRLCRCRTAADAAPREQITDQQTRILKEKQT